MKIDPENRVMVEHFYSLVKPRFSKDNFKPRKCLKCNVLFEQKGQEFSRYFCLRCVNKNKAVGVLAEY